MNAYEELVTTGRVGPVALEMILDVTAQTVRARNYPDPSRTGRWSPDDVAELAHEVVLAASGAQNFVDAVLSGAVDDASLRAIIARRVGTAFADRSRKSDAGHLAGRLTKLLSAHPDQFTSPHPRAWTLTPDPPTEPGRAATTEDLLRAAFNLTGIRRTRWSERAERRSPFAPEEDLVRLVTAVLARAGMPLPESTLIKVLAEYFSLNPAHCGLDDSPPAFALSHDADTAIEATSGLLAHAIWHQLSTDERQIVPWLEDSLSDAAGALGWSKTRAHRVRTATRTVLARALDLDLDADSGAAITAAVPVMTALQLLAATEQEGH